MKTILSKYFPAIYQLPNADVFEYWQRKKNRQTLFLVFK